MERGGVLEEERARGRKRERMTTEPPSIQNTASAILVQNKMYCQLWDWRAGLCGGGEIGLTESLNVSSTCREREWHSQEGERWQQTI